MLKKLCHSLTNGVILIGYFLKLHISFPAIYSCISLFLISHYSMLSLVFHYKRLVRILEESSKGSLECIWLVLQAGSSF